MITSDPQSEDTTRRFQQYAGWIRFAVHGLVASVLFLLMGCNGFNDPAPLHQGLLDLRGNRLTEVLQLRGEWLARAGADSSEFASFDYDDSHWTPVTVPGNFEQAGFSNEGLVWYRLHLRMRADTPPLKGFVAYAKNAHTLLVARPGTAPIEIGNSGQPAPSVEETVRSRAPVLFTLPADTALVLSWKIANYGYRGGGPFHAVLIGPERAVDSMLLRRTMAVSASFALYMIIALFFFASWFWLRHDSPALAISLLALVMAVRTTTVSGVWEVLLPTTFSFELRIFLEAFSFLALPGLFAYLLWTFLPDLFEPVHIGRFSFSPPVTLDTDSTKTVTPLLGQEWLPSMNTAVVCIGILLSIFTIPFLFSFTPWLASELMSVARWLSLVLLIGGALILLQGLIRGLPLGRTLAFGFLPVLAAAGHEILFHIGLYHGYSYLSAALLAFVLIQSIAVMRRNARFAGIAFRDAASLKQEIARQTKELRAATIAAQAANLAKSRFLSAVSHELRTPLTSITGYAQVLCDELNAVLEPQQEEFFTTIQTSGNRLLTLINDLLDIAKIEAGHLEVPLGSIAISPLVEGTVSQVYPLITKKDLALKLDLPTEPVYVYANGARLQQVLINLLSNAIKFTERGHVGVRVYESTLKGHPACAIAVYDTGTGITPEFQPQLFELFTQEQQAYQKTQRGTGLGLAICRDLVNRMQGIITVESQPGKGSTFTVLLNYGEGPAEEPANDEQAGHNGIAKEHAQTMVPSALAGGEQAHS